jgi:hypothetical protein
MGHLSRDVGFVLCAYHGGANEPHHACRSNLRTLSNRRLVAKLKK